jgi:hypothetical protein
MQSDIIAKTHVRLVEELRINAHPRTQRLGKDLAYARARAFSEVLEDMTGIPADEWLRMAASIADEPAEVDA